MFWRWFAMLKEFQAFVLRGNVIDLAVAVVIGAAFGAVITSLVDNLLMPLIAMIFGEPDFSGLTFTINDAIFGYGAFISAVVSFVLIATAIFFVVIKPIQAATSRRKKDDVIDEPPAPSEDVLLLREIRDLLQQQR